MSKLKIQMKLNQYQMPKFLKFGIWALFEIWILEFDILIL
jgi:hypothetical protein